MTTSFKTVNVFSCVIFIIIIWILPNEIVHPSFLDLPEYSTCEREALPSPYDNAHVKPACNINRRCN